MTRLRLRLAALVRAVRYTVGRSRCTLCLVPCGCRRFCPPCLRASLAVSVAVDAARYEPRHAPRHAPREWGPGANPGSTGSA